MGPVSLCPICKENVFYTLDVLAHLQEKHTQDEIGEWLLNSEIAIEAMEKNKGASV